MKKQPQKRRYHRASGWIAACAACMMLILCGITGQAARKGTVNVDNVNVRTEASAESERVCKVPKNTELAIAEETTGSDGSTWYSVTFTLEGSEKSGWIRSDMVTVTETEDTEETEGGTESGESPAPAGGYVIQEPVEEYPASDVLSGTSVQVGEESFTAWVVDAGVTGGRELYLVWASDGSGNQGWFYYDPQDRTFQREMGQFSGGSGEPGGMIQSLQNELEKLKDDSAKSLSQRLYAIIGLGALSAILLILVIVLAVKLRGTEYEYYDDEDDDEEEDDDDYYEEEPRKKRGGLFRRRSHDDEEDDEEEEKSDFDDLLVAVRKKWAEDEEQEAYGGKAKDMYEDEEEISDEEELLPDEELPEIDMSAVTEIEEAAVRASAEDEIEDFDIEILDLDDLDL